MNPVIPLPAPVSSVHFYRYVPHSQLAEEPPEWPEVEGLQLSSDEPDFLYSYITNVMWEHDDLIGYLIYDPQGRDFDSVDLWYAAQPQEGDLP